MNSYQLEDRKSDQSFLSGIPVTCPVCVSDKRAKELKVGNSIVVLLSNKQKYMGIICTSNLNLREDSPNLAEGTIVVQRK